MESRHAAHRNSVPDAAGAELAAAQGGHAALPDVVSPRTATWLWGYHVVPAAITKDAAPRLYAYPQTDASRIDYPPPTEVATVPIKSEAKVPWYC